MSKQYFGKYRAQVVDSEDPKKRGRIRVLCPATLGDSKSNWCNPCIPVTYEKGGDFAIPKVGETVWIEFEGGDVNKPLYVGNWWSENNTPSEPYDVHTRYSYWDNVKEKKVGIQSPNQPERYEMTVGGCLTKIVKDESIEFSVGASLIKMEVDKITISVGGSSIVLTPADITELAGMIKLN